MAKGKDGAAQLERYRVAHDLTREEVAAKVRTTAATISRLISRDRGPGIDLALRMKKVLGIPVEAWGRNGRSKAA